MSKSDKTGGPAFPQSGTYYDPNDPGMSLRDWFAGMALQGLLACPNVDGTRPNLTVEAYKYADAMLLERRWFYARK